jgi:cell wall assembly regulator SMI1
MPLVDIVRSAQGMRMEDQDGGVETLEFSPGLSAEEIADLERSLPCALPQDVRELLAFSRGFENGPLDICFSGLLDSFGMDEIFPSPLVIAHDGFGNYWVIDLLPGSTTWGPICYVCHDPAVVVFQTSTLEHFISEVLRFANPPHASEIDDVHEAATMRTREPTPSSPLRASAGCAETATTAAERPRRRRMTGSGHT